MMPRQKTKTKNEDLARIRNNQRRSRAKRLDYIRELEQKAQKYDEIIARGNHSPEEIPSQEDFKKLQTENAWMRGLLKTLDVHFNPLDAPPGSILDLDPCISTSITPPFTSDIIPEQNVANVSLPTFAEQWNTSESTAGLNAAATNHIGPEFDPFSLFTESNNITSWNLPPLDSTSATNRDLKPANHATKSLTNGNTTLCSLACQWVIQCNAKGVELDVLYFRMERGFKQGNSPLEGCRVDNQVLLSVLTEIS